MNLEATVPERHFDLIVCTEVLEHCGNIDVALANLCSMTRRYLILTVPSGPVFPIDRAMGHHRHFRPSELREMLERHGFHVDFVRRWGFPFHSAYKLAINLRPERMIASFAGGEYGSVEKFIGWCVRTLFFLNVPRAGWQLFALARPR